MKPLHTFAAIGSALALGSCLLGASSAQATIYHYYYDGAGRVVGVTGENSQLKSYKYDNADNRASYSLQIPTGPTSSQTLRANQSIFQDGALTSASGAYVLALQEDGNLVLSHGSKPIWSSGTSLKNASILVMQGDGNLCMYDPQFNFLWGQGNGQAGSYFIVQDDGNLVLYNASNVAIWGSGTQGQ